MRFFLSWLIVLFLVMPVAAQEDDALVREGVALFDQGNLDAAIGKFREALQKNPRNALATYELALTYTTKGDFQNCRAVLEPALEWPGDQREIRYMALGNCLDAAGLKDKAIEVYRRGLLIAPNDPRLNYNLAVSLVGKGKLDEARALLKRDVSGEPTHASGHYVLGRVFETQGFRVPAALEYLRFLSLERSGPRAKEVAQRTLALLNAAVQKKDEKNITITIDPNARKEEGDFGVLEMSLAMAAAVAQSPDKKPSSEAEGVAGQITTTLDMITEIGNQQDAQQYIWQNVIPFFSAMHERKLTEPFAYVAISSLDLPGTKEWITQNQAEVERLIKWLAPKAPAIAVPPKTP